MTKQTEHTTLVLEKLALQASEDGAWEVFKDAFATVSPERHHPPEVDENLPHDSVYELALLVQVLAPEVELGLTTQRAMGASEPTRIGYQISTWHGRAVVWPQFAESLVALKQGKVAYQDIKRTFPDLWAVDRSLHDAIAQGLAPEELASLWLTSPGRCLSHDLKVLQKDLADNDWQYGAANWGRERVMDAAGLSAPTAHPDGWLRLHGTLPGATGWPLDDEVGVALDALEHASPVSVRGAALTHLLNRAARNPVYEIGGFRQDVREILPMSIAAAFQDATPERHQQERFREKLERMILLYADRLATTHALLTEQGWHLARWLHGCLIRNPFFGQDEEALAAQLKAMLGELPEPAGQALSPGRVAVSVCLRDWALTIGACEHYAQHNLHVSPLPAPLVGALRDVAAQPMDEPLCDMECHRPQEGDPWRLPHVAPPMLARWLLTVQRVSWLGRAGEDVFRENWSLFRRDAAGMEWFAQAIRSEVNTLGEETRTLIASEWSELDQPEVKAPPHAAALVGLCILDRLETPDRVAALVKRSTPMWQVTLWQSWLELWRGDPPLALKALTHLLTLVENPELEDTVRLTAAYHIARELQRPVMAQRPDIDLQQRLDTVARKVPFSSYSPLRRELRRLGIRTS